MIQSFGFEFESEEEMLSVADKLWKKHGVTGEMEMYPVKEGKWRLNVHSEKQVRDSTLEKLPGKPVTVSSLSTMDKRKGNTDEDN